MEQEWYFCEEMSCPNLFQSEDCFGLDYCPSIKKRKDIVSFFMIDPEDENKEHYLGYKLANNLPAMMPLIFRKIVNERELNGVYKLTYDEYLEQGYCEPNEEKRLVHYPHLDNIPETTVLIAVENGEIVGTNTWTWDGPNGLHVDKDFSSDVKAVRKEGKKVAASWRIITKKSYHNQRAVVMGLIKYTVQDMVNSGVDTALFSFHKKHEKVYKRLLNMSTVAEAEGFPAAKGGKSIPAVLMRLDKEDVPETFKQRSNHGDQCKTDFQSPQYWAIGKGLGGNGQSSGNTPATWSFGFNQRYGEGSTSGLQRERTESISSEPRYSLNWLRSYKRRWFGMERSPRTFLSRYVGSYGSSIQGSFGWKYGSGSARSTRQRTQGKALKLRYMPIYWIAYLSVRFRRNNYGYQ